MRSEIRKEKDKGYNIFLTITIALGGFYFGFYISVFNSIGTPLLTQEYELKSIKKQEILGNINLLFALGAMISVIIVGYTVDYFGRIKVIFFGEILSFLTYILYTQNNLIILQLTRVISGIIAGINTAAAHICMKELLPPKFNVLGGMIIYVTVVLGGLVVFSLGYFFTDEHLVKYHQYILCSGSLISFYRLITLFYFNFDTPRFYFTKYPKDEAKELTTTVLRKIYREENLVKLLKEEEDCFEEESRVKTDFKSLFKPKLKQRLIAGLVVNIGQQLSGINFLYLYSTDLFNNIGANGKLISFAMGITKVIVGLLGAWVLNKFGRRPVIMYGVLVQGFSFMVIIFMIESFRNVLFIPVCMYQIGYSLGIGATTLIYTADVLPPVGVGFALSIQWVFTSMVGKLVPLFLEK